MKCGYCSNSCIKAGLQKKGVQKYFCKPCKKYQQDRYIRQAWQVGMNERIKRLLTEGLSMRGISRILNITLSTVISRIRRIAAATKQPLDRAKGHSYEIDEMWTFVSSKANELWLMYAFDRTTGKVVDFKIGARTKENLKQITEYVLDRVPKRICTDRLRAYPGLIPGILHRVGSMNTCHIERFNLTLRTHLKRLSRKTICFSKSEEMLEACLRIYFWGTRSSAIGI